MDTLKVSGSSPGEIRIVLLLNLNIYITAKWLYLILAFCSRRVISKTILVIYVYVIMAGSCSNEVR